MEEFEVLSNGMRILQTESLFRLGTDSILLANFCGKLHGGKIADLGCGGGALGVLLCAADPNCHVTGIEIQPAACKIAEKNIRINQLEARFSVVNGDLRQIQSLLPANGFDHVVSNPPIFLLEAAQNPRVTRWPLQGRKSAVPRKTCVPLPGGFCALGAASALSTARNG